MIYDHSTQTHTEPRESLGGQWKGTVARRQATTLPCLWKRSTRYTYRYLFLTPSYFGVSYDWQFLEGGSYYRAQTGLKLVILLPQLLKCWNYSSVTSCPGTTCPLHFYYTHTTQFKKSQVLYSRELSSCHHKQRYILFTPPAFISSHSVPDTLLHPRQH